MGNFRDRVKKEIKKQDGGAATPKPPSAEPLVESGRTRQVDMKDAAQQEAAIAASEASARSAPSAPAQAEVPDDEQVTAEVAVKPAPEAKPAEKAPAPAPSPKAVPPPVRKAPVAEVPSAPAEAAPEAEAPKAEAPAPAKAPLDMTALLEAVKTAVDEQLAPIRKQVEGLVAQVAEFGEKLAGIQETVSGNDEMLNQFGQGLDGLDEGLGALKTELGTLSSKVGTISTDVGELKTAVQQNDELVGKLGDAVDGLDDAVTGLLGQDRAAALAPFEGEPAITLLLEQVSETAGHVDSLVGKDGERIQSLVNDNGVLTAKVFVSELVQQKPDEAKLVKIAIERGFDTSKDVLRELASDSQFATEIVGALRLAPSERLDDPALGEVKAEVVETAKAVSQRAAIYYKKLDWAQIEAASKEEQSGRDE